MGYDYDKDPLWHTEQKANLFDRVWFYHCDHLGTPQEMSDQTGAIVWTANYKAWGECKTENHTKRDIWDSEIITNNIRFQGQYFDQETGLHYNRFRYYSPYVGRFISKDPIGLLGGLNTFAYAPNPVGWVDPFGLAKRGRHGNLKKVKKGGQSHHLNQDAAFKSIIPHKDGAAIQLKGNAFCDIDSDHYNAHESLEAFWDDYRQGGSKYPSIPTIAEYNKALSTALATTSLSAKDRYKALSSAVRQQKSYELNDDDLIPKIPGKLGQKKR